MEMYCGAHIAHIAREIAFFSDSATTGSRRVSAIKMHLLYCGFGAFDIYIEPSAGYLSAAVLYLTASTILIAILRELPALSDPYLPKQKSRWRALRCWPYP